MPTQLERNGDFSQSFDNQGRLLFIRDPQLAGNCNVTTGGPACFPGNVIPANRINATAQRLLNLFPLPNATPSGPNFNNYAFQTVQDWPRNDQVLRSTTTSRRTRRCTGRLQFGYEKRAGPVSFLGSGGGWPQQPSKYEIDTVSYVNTLLHTFNPTLFRRGDGRRELGAPVHQRVRRRGDATATTGGSCCRGSRSSSRRRTLTGSCRTPRSPAARPGTVASFNDRQPLAVLRLQHAVELLRQHHEDRRVAQHEGRPVRRAHDPSGAARRRPTTAR